MIGPCSDCERNSYALQLVGGHLEAMKAAWRPKSILGLEADELLRRVAGQREQELVRQLAAFRPGWWRTRDRESTIWSACRHQGDFRFPESLVNDPEPPWSLWVAGSKELVEELGNSPSAGIVGARRADAYGTAVARDLGRAVARAGGTVISGLAFGIDAAAHRGALDIPTGRTLAVTGGGVDVVYPKAHLSLHSEIASRGSVMSEMPPGAGLWKWSFPARNRLIAALSSAVVVVQGARRSGSLHTADAALARSVQVAAVPGRIDVSVSEGTNQLLVDGAIAITGSDSLLRLLGLSSAAKGQDLTGDLKVVARAIADGSLDQAIAGLGASPGSAALARLELMGLAEVGSDGCWRLVG